MRIKHLVKIAFIGLRTNKIRSALTMLGIVIGITSIILIMAVGEGAQNLILDQIRGMGSRTIFIEPGREPQGFSDFLEMLTDSLKEKDFKALQNPANVQGVKEITPEVAQIMSVVYRDEAIRTTIVGTSELFGQILDLQPAEGNFFTADDIRQKASVAVIGAKVKEKLFGDSDALSQKIKIKGKTFRVIGVLSKKGQITFFDVDDMIAVPYSTAQKYLLGINHYHAIVLQAESEEIVPRIVEDIKITLRETHDIIDPAKDDFHVTSQADAAERVEIIMDILTVFLMAVAAISLLVGGIGIMNIMLISVTERTREIGLRKALGATEKNIMSQFLLESVFLTASGGLVGVILGAIFSWLIAFGLSQTVVSGWSFVFPVSAALLGLGVAAFVGLVFGFYPARRAAKLNPIEALRRE